MKFTPRSLVSVICLAAALALPAAASATYQQGDTPTPVRTENGPRPPAAVVPTEVRTITVDGGSSSNTLPIVFASIALGVALSGAAYLTVRLRALPRRS
ncbi:MAG: hypothetical protein ACXVRH_08645 [Thermoleophilaceae bacterium]